MSEKDEQEWPDHLDALVAAPDYHKLLMENEQVRVLDTLIPSGETVPVHTHRWPSVFYVLSWGDFVRCDGEGKVLVDTRQGGGAEEPPEVVWSPPLPPHSLENVGDTDIHIISVEIKD